MHNSYYPDNEDLGESVPLSSVPKAKVRIKEQTKDTDEVEKCIENEYRKSILTYSSGTNSKQTRRGWKRYVGVFSAFLTGFLISLNMLLVRLLRDHDHHPLAISVWRYVGNIPITFALFAYFVIRKRGKLFHNLWPLTWDKEKWIVHIMLGLNGILSWTYITLRYYSLRYLTLADSALICYSSPVVVVILAHFILKEKCGVVSILVSVIAVIGVAVISRPPILSERNEFDTGLLIGIAIATGGMLVQSFTSIVIRRLRQVHFSVMIFIHAIYGSILSVGTGVSLGVLQLVPESRIDQIYVGCLIISAFGIQIFLTLAFKFEEAARVTLILCIEIVLSFIWQYLFLDTSPDVYSLVGSVIIISTVLVTLVRKWLEGLPDGNKARKWCCCLLK